MPICLDGHTQFQDGCRSCEAGNFRSGHEGQTTTVPHGFVPTQDDSESCNICSGVPGDPIHHLRIESRNRQAQDAARNRDLGKTQGRESPKSIVLGFAIAGIVGAILAGGYFLWDSRTEEIQVSEISTGPVDSGDGSTAVPETPAASTSTTSLERGSPKWIATLEFAVHQLVNFERQRNLLSALSQDPELAEIARAHSEDMALNNYFEHENLAGQTAADRGNAVGYRCLKEFGNFYTEGISENIFQGWMYSSFNPRGRNYMALEDLAFQIVVDWMESPGHRENILTETYDRGGIGVGIGAEESVWVTQNFC